MPQPGSFGRRPSSRTPSPATRSAPSPSAPAGWASQTDSLFSRARAEADDAARLGMLPPLAETQSLEAELAEWKARRRGGFKLPWRQMSLMASLCFGIASFVLPDDVNAMVNWLLYGLMAASFLVGVTGGRKKTSKPV